MLAKNDANRIRSLSESAIAYIRLFFTKAIEELHIIEVQIGDELIEEDIERFEWEWE